LQLWMWLRCECGPSLREFMSSIMRWRSDLSSSDRARGRATRAAGYRTAILCRGTSRLFGAVHSSTGVEN
jgi:hypothetical protein